MDIINGGDGNDTLNGGRGADIMTGGLGNDTYLVDNFADKVIELTGEGTDLIKTSLITYSLAPAVLLNIENLEYTGTGSFTGNGNLNANTLTGNGGNDTLNGGAGADTMIGGLGNDTYWVDDADDVVTESAAAGTDSVKSGVTYTLVANTENLTLTGTAQIDATGNASDNVLTGNAAANVLDGGLGTDKLLGGAGNDTLVYDSADSKIDGGAGSDTLKISGANITLDLNALTTGKITGIEKLDLTGNGDNSLLVNMASLLKLTGTDGHNLYVTGDAGDSVNITGAMWANKGVAANGYHHYTHATLGVVDHLYVQNTLTQNLV